MLLCLNTRTMNSTTACIWFREIPAYYPRTCRIGMTSWWKMIHTLARLLAVSSRLKGWKQVCYVSRWNWIVLAYQILLPVVLVWFYFGCRFCCWHPNTSSFNDVVIETRQHSIIFCLCFIITSYNILLILYYYVVLNVWAFIELA